MDEQNVGLEQNVVPQTPNQKKDGNGFGIASFVLGIVSLLLFCICVNWITGILAVIFGVIQLVGYKQKGFAVGGIVTACISFVLNILLCILLSVGAIADGYFDGDDYQWDIDISEEATDTQVTCAVFSDEEWHILL
jgi:hypothetical protein